MANLVALRSELDAGHPTSGAYSVNDEVAAQQLHAKNRPADGGINAMLTYLITNRARSNQGTDDTNTAILGRIEHVAQSAVGSDPFGSTIPLTLEHIHAAKMILFLMGSPNLDTVDFVDTEFSNALSALAGGSGCRAMRNADRAAIEALSQNRQSRVQELANELGTNRIRPGDVTQARAL